MAVVGMVVTDNVQGYGRTLFPDFSFLTLKIYIEIQAL